MTLLIPLNFSSFPRYPYYNVIVRIIRYPADITESHVYPSFLCRYNVSELGLLNHPDLSISQYPVCFVHFVCWSLCACINLARFDVILTTNMRVYFIIQRVYNKYSAREVERVPLSSVDTKFVAIYEIFRGK